jgi:glycosyltransferase involved in cell wall biosynthesis
VGQSGASGGLSILYLSWRDWQNPEAGGAEIFLDRTSHFLVERGHRVTVLASGFPGAAPVTMDGGVRVLRLGRRYSVFARAAAHLLRRGHRYDVIVDVQNGVPFWSPLLTRTPVVNLVHHVHREQWASVFPWALARLGWWLESRVAPRVYRRSRYLTVSEATREELALLGVDRTRMTIVHSGNDQPDDMARYVALPRSPHPSLVSLGRLVPHKQVELAIDVVRELRPRFPELRLHVVGDGYWMPSLVEYAEASGLADHVTFHGYVDDAAKQYLLATAWVAVLPSIKEGWGLTILEAALHETPTVAFRSAGGPQDSVRDGETGLLADNYAEFRDAVAALLDDHARRDDIGKKARAFAETFDWSTAGRAVAELLEDTAATRGSQETDPLREGGRAVF